jgi:hypothetical protein
MSYFMTLAGNPVNLAGFEPLELIPVMQAQTYLQELAPTIITADGEPLFLVHDGKTGTSHDLLVTAAENWYLDRTVGDRKLLSLLQLVCDSSHVFRIWWAGDPNSHEELEHCSTIEDVISEIGRQLADGNDIAIRYSPQISTI